MNKAPRQLDPNYIPNDIKRLMSEEQLIFVLWDCLGQSKSNQIGRFHGYSSKSTVTI